MKVRPKKYHPLVDAFDTQHVANVMRESSRNVLETVMNMPRHDEFIRQHCAVKKWGE